MIKKTEKRTGFKLLIEKYGLDYVIKNIDKLLKYKSEFYHPRYKRQLPTILKKRYAKKES